MTIPGRGVLLRQQHVSYQVAPDSESEAAGDEDKEY